MKTCNICSIPKSISKFGIKADNKDGHSNTCRQCHTINVQAYHRTKRGLAMRIYNSQIQSAKERGHPLPDYSREELFTWIQDNPKFARLYKVWKQSSYMSCLKPSCDRLDNSKSYALSNLQLLTWEDHDAKFKQECVSGVETSRSSKINQLTKTGEYIRTYYSMHSAARITGIRQGNISLVCNNKHKTAGGFQWEYA